MVGVSLWIVPTNAIDGHCSLSHELSPHMVSILSKFFGMITNPLFFLGLGSPI
jgi:hypothetical protein